VIFTVYNEKLIDKNQEECMQLAQQISSMILSLRRKAGKKVVSHCQKPLCRLPMIKFIGD
jgi:hypothetical protein